MVEKATMKNIVIINNYGSMNIGDYAIQASGFRIIKQCLPADSRIRLIADADFIIGMGGGFFVSKNKITDFYGLCLMLLPIYIGRLYHKKLFSLPITFGPFASSIHQELALRAIETSIILCRDTISV